MAIDWQWIRREFEEAGAAEKELASRYKCSAGTIRKRARKEGWERLGQGSGATAPARPGHVIDDHRSLWKGVKKRLVRGLTNNDVKQGLEELKVAKMAGEVLSSVIKGERLAWGLAGDEESEDADDIAGEMERATVSPGAGEALEGVQEVRGRPGRKEER